MNDIKKLKDIIENTYFVNGNIVDNVDSTFDIHIKLKVYGVDSEIKHGWIIDDANNYIVRAIVYLVIYMSGSIYYMYIDGNNFRLSLTKSRQQFIFSKRPNQKRIETYKKKDRIRKGKLHVSNSIGFNDNINNVFST